jgi:hypothetical protein
VLIRSEWSTGYLLQEIANYVPRDSGEAFKICEKVFPRLQVPLVVVSFLLFVVVVVVVVS